MTDTTEPVSAPDLPKAHVVASGLTRAEWLPERRNGIGGSDIAALLGISPYGNPATLFMDKRGELPIDHEPTPAQEWGLELEEPIRRMFQRKTGTVILRLPENTMYRSNELPIAQITPDGLIADLTGCFEAKTSTQYKADMWEDEYGNGIVPPYYEAQAQWATAVTGLPVAEFGVLIGGADFRTITVEADPILHEMLFERATEFWELVLSGTMPDLDGSSASARALERRFPRAVRGTSIELGAPLRELVAKWRSAQEYRKTLELAEAELENQIKFMLGVNEEGTAGGVPLVTWKSQERRSIPLKAVQERCPELLPELVKVSDFRVLRPCNDKKRKGLNP